MGGAFRHDWHGDNNGWNSPSRCWIRIHSISGQQRGKNSAVPGTYRPAMVYHKISRKNNGSLDDHRLHNMFGVRVRLDGFGVKAEYICEENQARGNR